MSACHRLLNGLLLLAALLADNAIAAEQLANTIERIKPAVVGVGSFDKLRKPPVRLLGTGFVISDGLHVVTNAHVIHAAREDAQARPGIISGRGSRMQWRDALDIRFDQTHDLALFRIEGRPLPVFRLGDSDRVREGEAIAFTGFPIGSVLGLYPATHRGIIAAITPHAIPADRATGLDAAAIRALRDPFNVFQLDATAFPGNSGSPLYRPATGRVIGIINKTLVQGTRERALSQPSGISFAIPVNHVKALMKKAGLAPE